MSDAFNREAVLEFMEWCKQHGGSTPETPEATFELTSLEINSRWSNVDTLPNSLAALTNLTHLTFEPRFSMGSREWPQVLDNMPNLTHLSLEGCRFKEASTCWGNYPNLVLLDLSKNLLATLHPSIGSLKSLESLVLNQCQGGNNSCGAARTNKVFTLPDNVGQLSALKLLDISFTVMPSLPESIGQLKSLEAIEAHSVEQLVSLPESISQCSALKELDLWNCEVAQLPESLGQLTQLEQLSLYDNGLKSLPSNIGSLTSLTHLDASSNELTSLPDSIAQCVALQDLDLANNAIGALPSNIGQLTALSSLDLGSNEISEIPDSICHLSALKILNLGFNKLVNLPDGLGQLSALNRLKITSNKINVLPPWIGQLSALTRLDMAANSLETLPVEIANLSSLENLDASHNQLTSIPEQLGELAALKELKVSNTQLECLPESLIRRRSKMKIECRNTPLADNEKDEGIRLMKACLKGDLEAAEHAVLAGANMKMTVGDCVDLGSRDSYSGDWGPPALFWATIIPRSAKLVKLMLDSGASVKARWPYAGEWDPDDCWMDTDETMVGTTLNELADQGKSANLNAWSKGRKKLKKYGVKVRNEQLIVAPDPEAMQLIADAMEP